MESRGERTEEGKTKNCSGRMGLETTMPCIFFSLNCVDLHIEGRKVLRERKAGIIKERFKKGQSDFVSPYYQSKRKRRGKKEKSDSRFRFIFESGGG